MNQQEYELGSFENLFGKIMTEQSDNDRFHNEAAIHELQFGAARVEVIIGCDLVERLKDISVEIHDKVVAALKGVVDDCDEEIAERRND